MKIICECCKKQMGEIDPLNESKEIKAACAECIEKEKNERVMKLLRTPLNEKEPKDRIVTLENGAQGLLTMAGTETEELGFWEILLDGQKFFCYESERKEFEEFLEHLPNDEVYITFLYKISVNLPPKKSKKKNFSIPVDEPNRESINYNCTVRGTKNFAKHVFEAKEDQFKQYFDIVWPIAHRIYREEQSLKAAGQGQGTD